MTFLFRQVFIQTGLLPALIVCFWRCYQIDQIIFRISIPLALFAFPQTLSTLSLIITNKNSTFFYYLAKLIHRQESLLFSDSIYNWKDRISRRSAENLSKFEPKWAFWPLEKSSGWVGNFWIKGGVGHQACFWISGYWTAQLFIHKRFVACCTWRHLCYGKAP